MKARGSGWGGGQIENGDKREEEEEEKEDKNLIRSLRFQSCTQHSQSSSPSLQASSSAYFFMRTLTACEVSDKCTAVPEQSRSQ